MDITQNEAIAYAQAAMGVQFVQVEYVDRFGEYDEAPRKTAPSKRPGTGYYYKVPLHLVEDLHVGQHFIAQVLLKHFAVVRILEIFGEPPTSDEYNYSTKAGLKWLIAPVDTELSKELTAGDQAALRALNRASMRTRLNEINAALGVDLSTVVGPTLVRIGAKSEVVEEVAEEVAPDPIFED